MAKRIITLTKLVHSKTQRGKTYLTCLFKKTGQKIRFIVKIYTKILQK